jgi:hypothetical protein
LPADLTFAEEQRPEQRPFAPLPGRRLPIQSYFNGKVLDLQIYNSVFTTINQQNLPLSYSEVTYSVFREHFPPHLLMYVRPQSGSTG